MLNGIEESLEQRLIQAEEAEAEYSKLEALAVAAPQLRAQFAKAQKEAERKETRNAAISEARRAVEAAAGKQAQVPGMLETVSKVVYSFYSLLKEIDGHRRMAMQCLSVADRMDYEAELDAGVEAQKEMGRDPVGLDFVYAAKHGDTRVKQLLEEMDPSFQFLKDCHMEHPMNRDVANFILAHAISPATPAAPKPRVEQQQSEIQPER